MKEAYNRIRNACFGVGVTAIPVPAAKALIVRGAIYVYEGLYFATAETGDFEPAPKPELIEPVVDQRELF